MAPTRAAGHATELAGVPRRRRGRCHGRRRHLQRGRERRCRPASRWACCPPARRPCSPASWAGRRTCCGRREGLAESIPAGRRAHDRPGTHERPPFHVLGRVRAGRRGDAAGARGARRRTTSCGGRATCGWSAPRSARCVPTAGRCRIGATLHDGERELRCSYVAVANATRTPTSARWASRATPRASFDAGAGSSSPRATCERRDLWRLGVYGLVWPRHATGRDPRVAYLHDRSALTLVGRPDGVRAGRRRVRRPAGAGGDLVYEPDAVTVFVPTGSSPAPAPAAAGT